MEEDETFPGLTSTEYQRWAKFRLRDPILQNRCRSSKTDADLPKPMPNFQTGADLPGTCVGRSFHEH